MNMELKELSINDIEMIKSLFVSVFTKEPWNDDWSDEKQLHAYIMDLTGNQNSLTLGLFENDSIVGIAMGEIKHWYEGTEYFINEFCTQQKAQGRGIGTQFMEMIQENIKARGIVHIFLLTERNVPAYHFYHKNGFQELESSVAFWKNC